MLYDALDIPAGGSKTLTYSVVVNTQNEWVVSEGGSVAGIRSNVLKPLEPEQTEKVYVYLGGDVFAQDLFFCFRPTLAE